MSSARRLCEGGYFDLERPLSHEEESWDLLCSSAWEYQWVRNPVDYSSEIADALYDVSQGISGIMLSVFATAQLAAMEEDGAETVDADLIRKVYRERMKPLHPAIRILQSGDPRLMDKFDDLYRNAYPTIDRSQDDTSAERQAGSEECPNSSETQQSADTPDTKSQSKTGRSTRQTSAPTQRLTEDQIKKFVTADSIGDLVSLLERP